MAPESKFTLNPRVSVFRHNDGIYLFDPATRAYASMNEAMLAFVTKPDDANSFDKLSDNDRKELADVAEQLHTMGILIAPESANESKKNVKPKHLGSMDHLTIFVTTKCNLRCSYCYAWGGDSEKTISKDIWQPVMDYFFSNLRSTSTGGRPIRKNVNLALHGGGEPTVEFSILKEIVAEFNARARADGLQPSVGMGTNGTYDDSVCQWIIENNISVNISLDGPRDIHNCLRPFRTGEPSYDVVVRNLQTLVQKGRRAAVRATVTNESVVTMEETIRMAKQLGLTAVHFEPVTLTGRCFNTAIARPDAEQFAENFLQCYLLGQKCGVTVKYSGVRCFDYSRQRFCAACSDHLCVTPDGNITTCYEVLDLNDPAASEFFIGKVDTLQGRVMLDQTRIEKLKLRVADNMEACNGCFLRYHCAGDCPIKSFRYSNRDLYSPDPYRCQITNRINKQLIAWLADGIVKLRDVEQIDVISLNQNLI